MSRYFVVLICWSSFAAASQALVLGAQNSLELSRMPTVLSTSQLSGIGHQSDTTSAVTTTNPSPAASVTPQDLVAQTDDDNFFINAVIVDDTGIDDFLTCAQEQVQCLKYQQHQQEREIVFYGKIFTAQLAQHLQSDQP